MFRTNCSCRFTRLACSSQLALAAYCTHIIRRSLFYLFVNSTQRAESEGEEEEGGEGKRWRTVLGFEWHSQPRKTCTPLFTLGWGRTSWLRGRKGWGQHGLQQSWQQHSACRPTLCSHCSRSSLRKTLESQYPAQTANRAPQTNTAVVAMGIDSC